MRVDNVRPFNGSASVLLNFSSSEPCWFDLSSASGNCRDTSDTFFVSPNRRALDDPLTADEGLAPNQLPPTTLLLNARAAANATNPTTVDSPDTTPRGDSFSTGAKAAVGVAIALLCVAIGAMAAFLYFRRRRRSPDAEVSGGMLDGDRRTGRRGPEKKKHNDRLSDTSSRADEPLCPIQPVFDGFPGSMGYDDERSLHSSFNAHSPGGHSPTHSNTSHVWTYDRSIEREELTAARLKSQLLQPTQTVVSYGPNPVTPTLTPRITPRLTTTTAPNPSASPLTPNDVALLDYASYPPLDHKPSPPRASAPPIVVSYGPNKVTPTPLVVSPTVPPDESIVNRQQQHPHSAHPYSHERHERQFSWEADSPLLGLGPVGMGGGMGPSMGPLPPYATTEDWEAMEKGAVRKLAEPMAQAELPPTKDGFYHYSSDVVEYELPVPEGSGNNRNHHQHQHGYGQGGIGGMGAQAGQNWGGAGGYRPGREIDEQKFLLDDEGEMRALREQKARIRAAAAAKAEAERRAREEGRNPEGEEEVAGEYDLGEVRGAGWR